MDSEQKQSVYNLQTQFLYKFYFQLVATEQIKKKELKIDQLFAAILATQLQSTTNKFTAFLNQYHQFFNKSIDQQLTLEQFLRTQLELNSPIQIYKNSQTPEMSDIFKLTLVLINKYLAAYLQDNQSILQQVLTANIKQTGTHNKQLYQDLKNIIIKSNLEILHQFNFKLFGVKVQEVQNAPKVTQQDLKIKQLNKEKEKLKNINLTQKKQYEQIIDMKTMQITVLKQKIQSLEEIIKKQAVAVYKCTEIVQSISSEKQSSSSEKIASKPESSKIQQIQCSFEQKQDQPCDNIQHQEIEPEYKQEQSGDEGYLNEEEDCSSDVSGEQYQFDLDFSQLDDKSTLKKLEA